MVVPNNTQREVDISGVTCGSTSGANNYRSNSRTDNLEDHTTGHDVLTLTGSIRVKPDAEPELQIIENSDKFDKFDDVDDDIDVSNLGSEYTSIMEGIGYTGIATVQKATKFGGRQRRHRFYKADFKRGFKCGQPGFRNTSMFMKY